MCPSQIPTSTDWSFFFLFPTQRHPTAAAGNSSSSRGCEQGLKWQAMPERASCTGELDDCGASQFVRYLLYCWSEWLAIHSTRPGLAWHSPLCSLKSWRARRMSSETRNSCGKATGGLSWSLIELTLRKITLPRGASLQCVWWMGFLFLSFLKHMDKFPLIMDGLS